MSRDDTEYFFLHIFCSRRILGSPRDTFYVGDADPGVVTGHHIPLEAYGGLAGLGLALQRRSEESEAY